MPSYKLVYFNLRGRAEVSRMLFAQSGVEYEDCRITSEEFADLKGNVEKTPLGQLPVLEVDGKPLPQSKAIERYLAREFGMYGKNNQESTFIDVVCETVSDLVKPLVDVHFEKDEEKKKTMIEEFVDKKSVPMVSFFERCLEKSKQGKGYFIGETMTLADVMVFALLDSVETGLPHMIAKYPAVKAYIERMRKEEKLAAWLEKRPKTEF